MTSLTAPVPQITGYFGRSVALEGDRLVVSAHRDGEGGTPAGAIYVFEYDPLLASWSSTKLVGTTPFAQLGQSLDVSGSRIVAGGPMRDVVEVHELVGSNWLLAALLPSPNTGLGFGRDVAIEGSLVLVSEPDVLGLNGSARLFDGLAGYAEVERFDTQSTSSSDAIRFCVGP